MEVKYHISPKTGNPNRCYASKKPCPLGGEEVHFATKDEARKGFEQKQTITWHATTASTLEEEAVVLLQNGTEGKIASVAKDATHVSFMLTTVGNKQEQVFYRLPRKHVLQVTKAPEAKLTTSAVPWHEPSQSFTGKASNLPIFTTSLPPETFTLQSSTTGKEVPVTLQETFYHDDRSIAGWEFAPASTVGAWTIVISND